MTRSHSSPATVERFAQAVAETVAQQPPKRRDTPLGRFYDVDGESYPSVTFVLGVIGKPALIHWAANQERTLVSEASADLYEDLAKLPKPLARTAYLTTLQARIGKTRAHQRELAKAGEVGTQAHRLIEWSLRRALGQRVGPEPRVVDDAQWAYMAWEDWTRSVNLKPKYVEQVVFSRVHGYAGTLDLVGEVNGEERVIDFKTGKAIYPEAHLQNVAYQVALSEMGHGSPTGGLIVRLPKVQTDPAFEVVVVPPVADLMPTFLAVKELWRWWFTHEQARQRAREAIPATVPVVMPTAEEITWDLYARSPRRRRSPVVADERRTSAGCSGPTESS